MANEKILVVDDDTNICELLRLYLTKEGYQVTTANDGEEGLEKFSQVKPDMVLLDVMMPRLARENGAAILLITSDRHSPLAQQADHVLLASNREQRLIVGDHAPSQLSVLLVIEVLYYLMLLGK